MNNTCQTRLWFCLSQRYWKLNGRVFWYGRGAAVISLAGVSSDGSHELANFISGSRSDSCWPIRSASSSTPAPARSGPATSLSTPTRARPTRPLLRRLGPVSVPHDPVKLHLLMILVGFITIALSLLGALIHQTESNLLGRCAPKTSVAHHVEGHLKLPQDGWPFPELNRSRDCSRACPQY